jgi:predicted MFS family arabinose efflux permease
MRHRRWRPLVPLVLATLATQASIVVLAPIMVEIGRDLGASVSAIGQARTILAGTAAVTALAIGPLIDRIGVRPLILCGGALALAGDAAAAAAPSLLAFYLANAVVGLGVACLLSAGFAGVGDWFDESEAPWALGFVVGSQSIAWIVGNPAIGLLTDAFSWRAAYAVPAAAALAAIAGGLLAPRGRQRARSAERSTVGGVIADPSARRWAVAELVAYSAWTAELTYVGALYIHSYDVDEGVVGFLLAVGSIAFLISTLSTDKLIRTAGRRRALVVAAALGMGGMLAVIMNVTPSVAFTLGCFFVMALFAGVRTTGSSAIGLSQLPAQPGSMMAARTASSQVGYMVGALVGGLVLAVADFGTLGFVLLTGMVLSAALVMRVTDPSATRDADPTAVAPARAPATPG